MAREKLSMGKITEVLRLSQEQKLSIRAIARSCSLARSTVADYIWRARVAGLVWPLPEGMDRVMQVLSRHSQGENALCTCTKSL